MGQQAIETIVQIFQERGKEQYGTENVSQEEHAIQCACLAKRAGARPSQVLAALLHDIGHLLCDSEFVEMNSYGLNDWHEEKGYAWLSRYFSASVAEPVRLHVDAKRYLCTVERGYLHLLSPTSLKSLYDQGGLMLGDEISRFEEEYYFNEAIALRRWDDLAKVENKMIPRFEEFVPLIERLTLEYA